VTRRHLPKPTRKPRELTRTWNPDLVESRLYRALHQERCPFRRLRRHATERDARAFAARSEEKFGGRFEPFECPCGAWHLRDAEKAERRKGVDIA
jgi:hypothetical protein